MRPELLADTPAISLVTFARNEQENLPLLYQSILPVMQEVGMSWEFIIVDDHSVDGTFGCVEQIAAHDSRVRGIRFSRHFGSHAARACGLRGARGACAITLAADLQDPPAIIPAMIAKWREGAQIVAGVRATRNSESAGVRVSSRLYRHTMRRLMGVPDDAPDVTGYCLLDRKVVDACGLFSEQNSNSISLLQWMGFRLARVEYHQQARIHGNSNWTFGPKVKLTVDSITAFSSFPVRLMTYTGLCVFLLGLCTAVFGTGIRSTSGEFSPLVMVLAAVLLLGGLQVATMGILGEYLWRTLVEARRRPQYLVEETVGFPAGVAPQASYWTK